MMEFKPHALYELLSEDLNVREYSGTQFHAVQSLKKSFLKKSAFARTGECASAAIAAFRQRASYEMPALPLLPHARWALAHWLRPFGSDLCLFTEENILQGMKTGPGSSLHAFQKSTCGMLKLFHGRISCSSEQLYCEYVRLIGNNDPLWFAAELNRAELYGPPLFTRGNRITTVPKDNKIDRVIAVEPTVNSAFQQGVMSVLNACLNRVGLDLETTPDNNRRLARAGSLGHGLATVDFTAASDSISQDLLQVLLPEDVDSYIRFVSSPNFFVGDECIPARRIALSMGNAVTFPLQTLIFLALCYEIFRRNDRPFIVGKNISVFGDDIVMPDDLAPQFIELAEQCGFFPNREKSYYSGEFRESCGTDWFSGVNIRGVYVREHKGIGALYSTRNLLWAWAYRWGIDLPKSIGYLDKLLIEGKSFNLVPLHAPINSGVRVPSAPEGSYNRRKQAYVFDALQVSYRGRLGRHLIDANPEGSMVGSLFGYIRDGRILERPKAWQVRYRKKRSHSCWGWDTTNAGESWLYDAACTTGGSLIS